MCVYIYIIIYIYIYIYIIGISTPIMKICIMGVMVNFKALFNCYTVILCFCMRIQVLCLFSDDNSGWWVISNFSLRQRLHLLLVLL